MTQKAPNLWERHEINRNIDISVLHKSPGKMHHNVCRK